MNDKLIGYGFTVAFLILGWLFLCLTVSLASRDDVACALGAALIAGFSLVAGIIVRYFEIEVV